MTTRSGDATLSRPHFILGPRMTEHSYRPSEADHPIPSPAPRSARNNGRPRAKAYDGVERLYWALEPSVVMVNPSDPGECLHSIHIKGILRNAAAGVTRRSAAARLSIIRDTLDLSLDARREEASSIDHPGPFALKGLYPQRITNLDPIAIECISQSFKTVFNIGHVERIAPSTMIQRLHALDRALDSNPVTTTLLWQAAENVHWRAGRSRQNVVLQHPFPVIKASRFYSDLTSARMRPPDHLAYVADLDFTRGERAPPSSQK